MKFDFLNINELRKELGMEDEDFRTDRIFFRLVNVRRNEKFLNEVPYRVIEGTDMAVTYCMCCKKDNKEVRSIIINNPWLAYISEEKLYMYAYENTRNIFMPCLLPLNTMVSLITGNEMDDSDNIPIYVLTNTDRGNGAVNLLYKDLLRDFAKRNQCSDIFIIPSSIHEVLLIPQINTSFDRDTLMEMLREANETVVMEEDILSDFIYVYDYDRDTILTESF